MTGASIETLEAFRRGGRMMSMALAQLDGPAQAHAAASFGCFRALDRYEEEIDVPPTERERLLRAAAAWLAGGGHGPCPTDGLEQWLDVAPAATRARLHTGAAVLALTMAEAVAVRWRFSTWDDLLGYVDGTGGTLTSMLRIGWSPSAFTMALPDKDRRWARAVHLSDMLIDRPRDIAAGVDLCPTKLDESAFETGAVEATASAIRDVRSGARSGGARFMHVILAVQHTRVRRWQTTGDRRNLADDELAQVVVDALGADHAQVSVDALHGRFRAPDEVGR